MSWTGSVCTLERSVAKTPSKRSALIVLPGIATPSKRNALTNCMRSELTVPSKGNALTNSPHSQQRNTQYPQHPASANALPTLAPPLVLFYHVQHKGSISSWSDQGLSLLQSYSVGIARYEFAVWATEGE